MFISIFIRNNTLGVDSRSHNSIATSVGNRSITSMWRERYTFVNPPWEWYIHLSWFLLSITITFLCVFIHWIYLDLFVLLFCFHSVYIGYCWNHKLRASTYPNIYFFFHTALTQCTTHIYDTHSHSCGLLIFWLK